MTTATLGNAWRPSDNLANRLRLVRMDLELSQRQAAERSGITARVWQNAEDGRAVRSQHAVIGAIALALGVDQEWLEHGGPLNAESPRPGGPDGGDGLADVTSLAPNAKKPSWCISQVATLAAAA